MLILYARKSFDFSMEILLFFSVSFFFSFFFFFWENICFFTRIAKINSTRITTFFINAKIYFTRNEFWWAIHESKSQKFRVFFPSQKFLPLKYNTYSLKHRLARGSCELEIKRVHCMMNIWNIDIFERDYITFFFNKPPSPPP